MRRSRRSPSRTRGELSPDPVVDTRDSREGRSGRRRHGGYNDTNIDTSIDAAPVAVRGSNSLPFGIDVADMQGTLPSTSGSIMTPSSHGDVPSPPSNDYDTSLTAESLLQRLQAVEAEKRDLEQYVEHITVESKLKLESSLEELKSGLEGKLNDLSSRLQHMYHPDISTGAITRPLKGKRISFDKNLYRKEFIPQESLLSKMLHYNDENYKTIFNIMIVVLVLWACGLAFDDITVQGLPDFGLLHWGIVRDFGVFMKYWFGMLAACIVCSLFLAHSIASARNRLAYYLSLAVYIAVQIAAFGASTWVIGHSTPARFSMPMAIAFMSEQSRMSMKMHSYIREKVTWQKYGGRLSAEPQTSHFLPVLGWGVPVQSYLHSEFDKVMLFMFVPTLIYRDLYPRMSKIRSSFLIIRSFEVLGLVYFTYLIFRQSLPQFIVMAGRPLTWQSFIRASFNCM
jgi:hypothetical protein